MVNKRLTQFYRQHQWKLVHHNNILTSKINRNGLHLNRRGNKLLDKNFVNSLLHWQAIPSADASNEIPAAGINTNASSESFNFLPSMRGFKLASSHNASLPKHIDELGVLLADCPLDVLLLDESVSNNKVYIPNYEIISRDWEHDSRPGEGIYFYVCSSINYSLHPDLSIQPLENLCIEIHKLRSKPFLIVTWYRPPSSSTEIFSHLETLIGKLDSVNAEFFLMGDFNWNFALSEPDNNTVSDTY